VKGIKLDEVIYIYIYITPIGIRQCKEFTDPQSLLNSMGNKVC
jgi:hypothetical protein